jgi:osmoprotectant transport system permease protein
MNDNLPFTQLLFWSMNHLLVMLVSLVVAILIAIPVGIRIADKPKVAEIFLSLSGLFQAISSLALLAVLVSVPILGIGFKTVVVMLSIYAILPIIRGTTLGMQRISPLHIDSAETLGLNPRLKLYFLYLPLASPTILTGIKTSIIGCIGNATMAALIGVPNLGVPVFTGLELNRIDIILEGAIPISILALFVHILFHFVDLLFIPKGLRLQMKIAKERW